MSPQPNNEVPNSQAEQILTDVLMSFFGQVVKQAVKEIGPTLNLPLVDESKRAAQQAEDDKASAKLNQLNEAIASREGILDAMSTTLVSENVPIEYKPTSAKTYLEIAEMGFPLRAKLLLSTAHASEINDVCQSVQHSIARQPEIYAALCLRLQREVAQSNLDRAMLKLKDESTSSVEKAVIIQAVEQLKSSLDEIDEKIDLLLITLG